jgi:hypothetical protein
MQESVMKKRMFYLVLAAMAFYSTAMGFETLTIAKVVNIDEYDSGFTRIQIESPTSCGSTLIWMSRTMPDYNLYMSRTLAALVSDRAVRIVERAPAYCDGQYLYNPRIGVN